MFLVSRLETVIRRSPDLHGAPTKLVVTPLMSSRLIILTIVFKLSKVLPEPEILEALNF